MRYVELEGASLRGVMLQGANLSMANLNGVDFTNGWLVAADLTGANLQGAAFTDTWLVFTDLRGLSGQRERSTIGASQIAEAKLHQAKMPKMIAEDPVVVTTISANSNLSRDVVYQEMKLRIDAVQR